MKNILYSTDGKGYWIRREWMQQCPKDVFLSGRCQGVQGHKGLHWCYDPSGYYRWEDNKDDPQEDGCSGSTPPGHKKYVSPKKMAKHYHMKYYKDTVITDKKLIARLEKNNPPEKGASIDRPLSEAECKKLDKLLPKKKKKRKHG